MTTLFTFSRNNSGSRGTAYWPLAVAVMLLAVTPPAVACEKSAARWTAGGPGEQTVTFTGEFVNGAPVYRLPEITVVTRRPAEVAKTQRDDARARVSRSRADATPVQAPRPAA